MEQDNEILVCAIFTGTKTQGCKSHGGSWY